MALPRLRLLAAPPSAAAAAPPLLVPRPQALARQLTPSPLLLSLLLPLLLLLLLSPAPASAQLSSAFSYSLPCAPASGNQDAGVRYAVGNTAYLCITLNGQVVSMYNVVVDRFTAIALQGCALSGDAARRLPSPRRGALRASCSRSLPAASHPPFRLPFIPQPTSRFHRTAASSATAWAT